MEVTIRRARDDDYAELSELWGQLDRLHARLFPAFFRSPPRPRPKGDLRSALRSDDRATLVATLGPGGRIVGAVQLHLYQVTQQPMMRSARRAYIEDLIVDVGHRGDGIGRKLMAFAQTWARARGACQLVLTVWDGNDQALEFYRTIGYRPINRVLVRDLDDEP